MRLFILSLSMWLCSNLASAHEVRPALLKIEQIEGQTYNALWKQPVLSGRRLKLTPTFSQNCDISDITQTVQLATVTETFKLSCDLSSGTITIDGLKRTLTDVFVDMTYLDGTQQTFLLRPDAPTATLGQTSGTGAAVAHYLRIGVEHIVFGWDHVLFVIGLALLVSARQVWGVATAFTLAHSLTLVLAALGWIALPSRPIEILIALSIAFLALEVSHKLRGRETLTIRHPYIISFFVGLIHGCGFAGALADIGLPKNAELFALFLFNIGIELGQFAIIAAVIALFWGLSIYSPRSAKRLKWVTIYSFAAIAMFWVFERTSAYWI